MDGKLCTLRESKEFGEQAKKITDIKYVDEALLGLTAAIVRNSSPDVFPLIPGFKNIQIAKTNSYTRGGVSVPPLRLWFRKIDDDIIELLAIEPYEKQTD